MKTITSAGVSDYQNRTVTIGVTGVAQQSVLKTGTYQVRVPYSQMSQALQSIHRQGGKVASVQLMGNPPATATAPENNDPADLPEEKQPGKRKRR
jgi:hypothetical protein